MKFATDFSKGILGEPDSTELWQDITSRFPDQVLTKPNVRILSVASGHCTEAVILARRMMQLGVSKTQVQESIWLIDKYQVFTHEATMVRGFKNVITEDYLQWETDMKFDVIVGNPPFQAPKKGDYSFWARFVDTAHSMLADDGYLAMVIPAGWMSPTNDIRQGQRSVMRDIFAKENTQYINIDPNLGKKYFPGIGQKFTWFCLQKGIYNKTKLDFGDRSIDIDLGRLPMLAKETDQINVEIVSKITSRQNKWEFTRYIMPETWDELRFQSDANLTFPRINGNSNHLDKVAFSQRPCRYQTHRKVVLPYNGSNYQFVIDSGTHGCTNAYVMLLEDTDKTQSAKTYFDSKLIKWVGKNKFTQYNEGALINCVSRMDLSVDITESDIYKFYNLTQEQIDYIENAVS